MIPDIAELNFPKKDGKQYATLTHAEVDLADMGEKTISTQVKIDGDITPDFSYNWAVEYRGEKYIMPLRIPQGSKGNESLNSAIDLTFQHWAVYQLKRWPFVTLQPIEAGTAIEDEEVATVQLNLGDFCDLLGKELKYWYGDAITIDLNPAWEYAPDVILIEISHTKIWNVLVDALYGKYGVRWSIEAAAGNSNTAPGGERYVIKIGYPTEELDHIFKNSFEGGLLKVERQVQSDEIRNLIKGRGGEKNLPRYYFKRVPEAEKEKNLWHDDPDWIVELENIPFSNLRGATFRSYVQGWKAAHLDATDAEGNPLYGGYKPVGEGNAYSAWAYRKGYTDTKFHPVEFVADEITPTPEEGDRQEEVLPGFTPYVKKGSSIDKYGPMPDTLDNNEEIYPTLQGTGMDIAVAVEQITSDNVGDTDPPDVTVSELGSIWLTVTLNGEERKSVTTSPRKYFEVPAGRTVNLIAEGIGPQNESSNVTVEGHRIYVYDSKGSRRSASGIPAGTYSYDIEIDVYNTSKENVMTNIGAERVRLQDAVLAEMTGGTFDIWMKNIWNSAKEDGETATAYAERIWRPVLGDRLGGEAAVVFTTGALAVSEDYEFKIVRIPVYDTSMQWTDDGGEEHVSHWRVTVAKSDADFDSLGKYVPNAERNGKAGDRFVLTGTEMTHIPYVVDAEKRLDDWKQDECDKSGEISPTYVVTPDRVRFNNEGREDALIHKIKPGCSVILEDKRFIGESERETLYIQSVKITYREPTSDDAALNPDIEMVLGNEYTASGDPVSRMQGEISVLQRQMGSISNVEQIVRKTGDKRYLRKDASDRTPYELTAGEGFKAGDYSAGKSGGRIDGTGSAELMDLILRGFLSSPKFADGFAGEGWRVWLEEGLSHLTVDKLTVRQTMAVFELLIEKIRAVGGQICVSAANGKIKEVRDDGDYWCLSFEQSLEFVGGDLIRCQTFDGESSRGYWVEVDDADSEDGAYILKSEFEGWSLPAPGDECVLMGSTRSTARQNLILISATEDGQPRIDVLDGVSSKSFAGCLRARLGALDGITDASFPEDRQPKGHGLYSDNAYLRGEFVLSTGEDVRTRFEVTDGKITSAVDALRGDVDLPGNFISNPMFADGMEGWESYDPSGSASPVSIEGGIAGVNGAGVIRDATGRPVLRIRSYAVRQVRSSMRGEPEDYPTDENGEKKPVPVYLSFMCRSATGGRLSAWLSGEKRPGFPNRYTPLYMERQISAGDSYSLITCSGLWNGAGALNLQMEEGEADIYMVTLSQDKAGTLAARYSTLFEQSDKLINISAKNFDANGNVIENSSITATARQISLGVQENIEGDLRRTGIDIESGEITLMSDLVRFKDSDGQDQAFITNGKINAKAIDVGEVTASSLKMYTEDADGNRAEHPTVVITPEAKGMEVRDENSGTVCQTFTGKTHSGGLSEFFGDGAGGSIPITQGGGSRGYASTDTVKGTRESVLAVSGALKLTSAATLIIKTGKLSASAEAKSGQVSATDPSIIVPEIYSSASVSVRLYLRLYSDEACTVIAEEHTIASLEAYSAARRKGSASIIPPENGGASQSVYDYTSTPDMKGINCAGTSIRTHSGGWAKLWISYRCVSSMAGCTALAAWGSSVGGSSLTAEYKTDLYMSHFFANGFCLGSRMDDYILAYHSSGGMVFESRSGGKGLRMTPTGGVETLIAGNTSDAYWSPVPKILCRCTYSFNSSTSNYIPAYDGYCIDGNYPAPARKAKGKVTLTLPASWATIIGSGFIPSRLRIRVEGRNSAFVHGAVTGISSTGVSVSLQDGAGAADGSFHLEIGII